MFEEMIGKKIRFFLKNNLCFSGEVLEVKNGFLKLNDIYKGIKIINLSTVTNTEEVKNETI